jgi:hypothetical protein
VTNEMMRRAYAVLASLVDLPVNQWTLHAGVSIHSGELYASVHGLPIDGDCADYRDNAVKASNMVACAARLGAVVKVRPGAVFGERDFWEVEARRGGISVSITTTMAAGYPVPPLPSGPVRADLAVRRTPGPVAA